MKVAIAGDHHGVQLKSELVEFLQRNGHTVVDVGPAATDPVDYPDFAEKVATLVAAHEAERGILICGSGIGMAMAANKVAGIRAALCHDVESAVLSRQHNNANVLCLPGKNADPANIQRVVEAWMTADFEGGRHARRVDKIRSIEQRHNSAG